MESCYVPNNPNFASVDQWTPPSPTSPPVSAGDHKQPDQEQQQQQPSFAHHDSVIQQLCCESADLIDDPSPTSQHHHHNLTSLSALPPVQVTLTQESKLFEQRADVSDGNHLGARWKNVFVVCNPQETTCLKLSQRTLETWALDTRDSSSFPSRK